ncbi:MAG: hypothetical protein H6918_02720 [Sphingomonadaceae bacterium]|nr:hypothetical protein [Sphingomonadaceae bacterium]
MSGKPNLTAFFLCIAALAGNATLAGFDIFLILAVPVGLVIFLRDPRLDSGGGGFGLWLALLALVPLAMRAPEIGIPYFELYWLWPWKAALLAILLLREGEARWPFANDLLLAGFTLLLLASARIEEGRMVSLFGPNMLYRFFGTGFIIALLRLGSVSGWQARFALGFAGLSAAAMVLTGSVGALGVFAAALYFARESLWRMLRSAGAILLAAGVAMLVLNWQAVVDSNLISRVLYKIDNLDRDDRLVGWSKLAGSDPGWAGLDYRDLAFAWTARSPYPHNLPLELYVFHGLFGLLLAALVLASFWFARRTRWVFYFPLLVILIGSLFSGDLSDNFAVLAFPVVMAAQYRALARPAFPHPAPRSAPA